MIQHLILLIILLTKVNSNWNYRNFKSIFPI